MVIIGGTLITIISFVLCTISRLWNLSKGEFILNKNTIESKEWEVISKEGTLYEIKYDCCPDPYQELDFELVLKRRSYYPVMTLVIPCIITAILICLTFFLPPDAGEKVGLSKSHLFNSQRLIIFPRHHYSVGHGGFHGSIVCSNTTNER